MYVKWSEQFKEWTTIDRFWLKIYFILYEPYQLSNFEQLENRNTDCPHFPKKINESNGGDHRKKGW